MIAMTSDAAFVIVWISITALVVAWALAGVVWAAKNRQFGGQNRARFLPLWSAIPPEGDASREGHGMAEKDVQP